METKEDKIAARQGAASPPTAGKADAGTRGTLPSSMADKLSRRDGAPTNEANPLLGQTKHSPQDPTPFHPTKSIPHESPITLRLNNAGLAWEEFNSMESTPPPQPVPMPSAAPIQAVRPRANRRWQLGFLATAVVIGLAVGLVALKLQKDSHPKVAPIEPERAAPRVEAPEEAVAPVAKPIPAEPAPALPAPREKPHVKVAAAADVHPDAKPTKPTKIERKAEPPVPHSHPSPRPAEQPAAKPEIEPTPKLAAKPENELKTKPVTGPVEEFGMDLKRPTPRHQTKMMDEKDPYSP